jgi:hypothetical protein
MAGTLYVNTIYPNTGSDVHISGSLKVSGSITIGDTDGDTIRVVAEFSSSLTPDKHRKFNIGRLDRFWDSGSIHYITGSVSHMQMTASAGHLSASRNLQARTASLGMVLLDDDGVIQAATNHQTHIKLSNNNYFDFITNNVTTARFASGGTTLNPYMATGNQFIYKGQTDAHLISARTSWYRICTYRR